MMKKTLAAAVLGISMALSLTAGAAQTDAQNTAKVENSVSESTESAQTETVEEAETTGSLEGGWEVNQGSLDPDDSSNKEAKEAFEKATEELTGYDYEPIYYLGTQVVAGTNYSYLCKGTVVYPDAQSEYVIVTVYEDLDGNASVTGTTELLEVSEDNAEGGWSYNQGEISLDKNEEVKNAFDKALEGLTGADYEPLAYIGSQVVSGTNYAVFCSVTPVVPDGQRSFCMLTVYEDLDGNASLEEEKDVDISGEN